MTVKCKTIGLSVVGTAPKAWIVIKNTLHEVGMIISI